MIRWLMERLARANRMPVDPAVREAERRACRAHDEAQAREALGEVTREDVARILRGER